MEDLELAFCCKFCQYYEVQHCSKRSTVNKESTFQITTPTMDTLSIPKLSYHNSILIHCMHASACVPEQDQSQSQ